MYCVLGLGAVFGSTSQLVPLTDRWRSHEYCRSEQWNVIFEASTVVNFGARTVMFKDSDFARVRSKQARIQIIWHLLTLCVDRVSFSFYSQVSVKPGLSDSCRTSLRINRTHRRLRMLLSSNYRVTASNPIVMVFSAAPFAYYSQWYRLESCSLCTGLV